VLVKEVNEAIKHSGGWGKFQHIVFLIIASGMVAGAFILYNMQYLLLKPKVYIMQETKDHSIEKDHDNTFYCKNRKNWYMA